MSSTGWNDALKQSLRRPGFLVVLLVLLVGAIGINAATTAMKLHFRKEAMPLRAKEGLSALPTQLGTWVMVPEVQTVNPDMAHELGTDKYVFRTYVDTAALYNGNPITTKEEVLALDKLSPEQRAQRVHNDWRLKNYNSVVNLAVTYYTGKADTVPHVPDRCMVADGFQPSSYDVKEWLLGDEAPGKPRKVPVRFIDFEDQTARGAQNRCVTYFFHANGAYTDSPLVVRQQLQDLFQRYGYFAKIEVMTLLQPRPGTTEKDPQRDGDRKVASAAVQRFLTAALPEVERILPDWNNRPK
jgi:hypothetical protein